jgi:uncharacterized protein (DUF1800 family)
MATDLDKLIQHLFRRVGFGARPDEISFAHTLRSVDEAADLLTSYERDADDVDSKIGAPGYAGVTAASGAFSPNSNIGDARQRWLFRMLHTNRPLQEKMTLFWHDHFATGYTKIANDLGSGSEGTRYMAAKASEDPGAVRGQIEMLRDNALGNFRDILLAVAQDVAMVVWLDGRTNTKNRPQENFAREVMELFTMGVGNYTEPDVYAGARVFTGWNMQRVGTGAAQHWEFVYNADNHDTDTKTFSFPIYPNGDATIPARSASQGMLDGIELINALAANRNTANYLCTKLYRFFVSEAGAVNQAWVDRMAAVYFQSGYSMRAVVRAIIVSNEFWDAQYKRYSWPVELVIRALKDFGWQGFSLSSAATPLNNMGQNLYEPPDVSGWALGPSWFSSGATLARVNFASTLSANQRFNLAAAGRAIPGITSGSNGAQTLLSAALGLAQVPPYDRALAGELLTYLQSTGAWTGSQSQLQSKVPGLVHLIIASPEYQLV